MTDLDNRMELEDKLRERANEVWRRASKRDFYGRTVTLKVKYADFREVSKRRTFSRPIEDFYTLRSVGVDLLETVEFGREKRIRLLGLSVSNARQTDESEDRQLKLDFGEDEAEEI
jgi:DNA polymerase-4